MKNFRVPRDSFCGYCSSILLLSPSQSPSAKNSAKNEWWRRRRQSLSLMGHGARRPGGLPPTARYREIFVVKDFMLFLLPPATCQASPTTKVRNFDAPAVTVHVRILCPLTGSSPCSIVAGQISFCFIVVVCSLTS